MSSDDKRTNLNDTGVASPATGYGCVSDSASSRNKLEHRRYIFLILFIVLATTLAIILILNNSFINHAPDMVVNDQPVEAITEIRELKADLTKVIDDLDEAKTNTDLRADQVEEETIVAKPVSVPVASVPVVVGPVVAPETIKQEPKKKVTEKAVEPVAVKQVVKTPAVVAVSEQVDIPQETAKPVEVLIETQVEEIQPSFIKYDSKGNELSDSHQQWSCVEDTRNGLIWEVKSRTDTMRRADNLYSWFDPDNKHIKGTADGGRCKGDIDCDTSAYVQAMNERNHCGYNDWKLPTKEQLQTIINLENSRDGVTINKEYFPETLPSWYWTSSENSQREELAWYVLFRNGHALSDLKERPKHIRIVRVTNTFVSSSQ